MEILSVFRKNETNTPRRIYVIYNNQIVDLTNFAEHHPGGYSLLHWYKNKDITQVYNLYHTHSAISAKILKTLHLKPESPYNEFIDLNKPLVPQILSLKCTKEKYFKQVHIPRFHKQICRFFSQHYLEVLTHTHWWVVPIFWGHLAIWFMAWSHSWNNLLYGLVFGILFWTIIEYCVHRFLFHMSAIVPAHPYFYAIHFLLHGVHHFLPTEETRLVLPIPFSGTMAIAVWQLYKYVFAIGFAEPLFAGTLLGYIFYDVGHYMIHYAGLKWTYFQKIKANHMAHHYVEPDRQFGVSSTLWDLIFGTGKK